MVASVTNIAIMVFSCYMIYVTRDLSLLTVLVTTSAAEVSTARAFYYNKAKMENTIKLQSIYKDLPILKENNEKEGIVND